MKNIRIDVRGSETIAKDLMALLDNGHANTIAAVWISGQKYLIRNFMKVCLIGIACSFTIDCILALVQKHQNKIQYEEES